MSYTSFVFAGFVILSLILYYIVPIKYRYLILFFVSAVFYVSNCGISITCPLLVSLLVYSSALLIDKQNKKYEAQKNNLEADKKKALRNRIKKNNQLMLALTIITCVLILIVLKYSSFIFKNSFSLNNDGLLFNLAPIGISYYTLMAISYITDVYRKTITPEKNYLKLSLYLIYFPIIVEGPIEKYSNISVKLTNGSEFDYDNFKSGTFKILFGLFKKLVIADRLAIYVNEVFENYGNYSSLATLLAIVFYTIQIYCDFSGCINVVEGVSQYFGINLSKNFDHPFFSKSIQEFWRRWHISLGTWLKDYIFYPVSLLVVNSNLYKKIKNNNLKNNISLLASNFAVWITMGLWHGISTKYVIYGLYYFVIIAISIIFVPIFIKTKNNSYGIGGKVRDKLCIIRTFILVNVGMFIFRANSLLDVSNMTKKVLNLKMTSINQIYTEIAEIFVNAGFELFEIKELYILLVSLIVLIIIDYLNNKYDNIVHKFFVNRSYISRTIIEICFVIIIITFGIYGSYSSEVFIYGAF